MKKLFSFACQALCLNSFQNAGFTFHEETVPGWTAFFFPSLVTEDWKQYSFDDQCILSNAMCLHASVNLAVEKEDKLCYL